MVDVNREMGERLGYLREKKFGKFHGSKTLCAQSLGISNGYWGDIERGRKRIGVDLIQRLGSFFEAENEWLLTGNSYNGKFLTEYYLHKLHEESEWFTKLCFLVELSVYWQQEKNNQFSKAAAAVLECHKDNKLLQKYAITFESDEISEVIDTLNSVSVSQETSQELEEYITQISAHLLEVKRPDDQSIKLPKSKEATALTNSTENPSEAISKSDENDEIIQLLKSKITVLEKEKDELKNTVKKLKKKLKKSKK